MRTTAKFLLVLTLCLLATQLPASNSTSQMGLELQRDAIFSAQEHGLSGMTVNIEIPSPVQRLESAGFDFRQNNSMPSIIRWVVLPSGVDATGTISHCENITYTVDNFGYANQQSSETMVNLNDNNPPVTIGKPVVFRGVRMAPIIINPVQREADQIVANRSITLELEYSQAENATVSVPKPLNEHFSRMIGDLTINPPARDLAATSLSRILIAYNEDLEQENVMDDLETFANWKRRMGYAVETIGIDVGQDQDDTKAAFQAYYDDVNAGSLDYIIIIGNWDNEEVDENSPYYFPVYGWVEQDGDRDVHIIGDIYYATFEGDDYIPEVITARFPCHSDEDLVYAIDRSIRYEQTPETGAWAERCLQSFNTSDIPDQLYQTELDIFFWEQPRLRDIGYSVIDTLWGPGLGRFDIAEPLQEAYSEGVGLGLATEWPWGIVEYDLDGNHDLQSIAEVGRKHPFLISNGEHYEDPVFVDFFNSGSADDEGGMIAGYGCWEPVDGNPLISYLEGWSVYGMRYLDIFQGGNLYQYALIQFSVIEEMAITVLPDLWEEMGQLHYIGDPTLTIRNAAEPIQISANLPDAFNAGATLVQFTLSDGEDPIANATVCIMQQDGIKYVSTSDDDGLVAFTVPEGLDPDEDLLITAYKHNFLPLVEDVEVGAPAVNIVLRESGFDDDDELFAAGETVGLTLTLANQGNQAAQNMTASFSSNSEYLEFSRESSPVENIAGGGTGSITEAVEMTLAADCPGRTELQIRVDVASGETHWMQAFEIVSSGANVELSNIDTDNLAPLSQGAVAIELINNGDLATEALTATLESNTNGVNIVQGEVNYAAINAGQTRSANGFSVELNDHFIPGDAINFTLTVASQNGFSTELEMTTDPVGDPAQNDPLIPDNYGYVCFGSEDDHDVWSAAPDYQWYEINPFRAVGTYFPGTMIPFVVDTALTRYNDLDENAVIQLPFTFRYYGQEYDSIIVCTDGWLSMGGSQIRARSNDARPIPDVGGIDGQISPFQINMDNNSSDQTAGVFTYFIEELNIFVIQWSGLKIVEAGNEGGMEFQVLLYDPEFYTTPTGDGEIAFQYNRIAMVAGDPNEFYQYPMVGIRSPDGLDGVLYSWINNEYEDHPLLGNPPVQAVEPVNGFSIKFTTLVQEEEGSIHGVVVDAENPDQAVSDAVVNIYREEPVVTDQNGAYAFNNIREGNYSVEIRATGYSTYSGVLTVEAGQDIELDPVQLLYPVPGLRDEEYRYSVRPDSSRVGAYACLENDGAGQLEYIAEVRYPDGSAVGTDQLHRMFLDESAYVSENVRQYIRGNGVAYSPEREQFFVPVFHSNTDSRYIAIVGKDGQWAGSFEQPIPANNADARLQSIAWDGENLWGGWQTVRDGNPGYMVRFSPAGDSLDGFELPFPNYDVIPVSYSPQRSSLFITENDQDIVEFDAEGNVIGTIPFNVPGHVAFITGMGWYPYDPDGMPLYVVDDWAPDGEDFVSAGIYKINPETGDWLPAPPVMFDPENTPRDIFGICPVMNYDESRNALAYVLNYGTSRRAADSLVVRELGINLNFMVPNSFVDMAGVIPAGSFDWLGFEVEGNGWAHGTEASWSYYINHNGRVDPLLAHVTVVFDTLSGIDTDIDLVPLKFGLQNVYPNPFNNVVKVSYFLDRSEKVRLAAYDLMGREAAVLMDGGQDVGVHSVHWNADQLASGVYVIQLEANGKIDSRKAVLLK